MSISYSALTNFGKITLPSVETWGTNMNILRDPPKSITTRKIDKVGETSSITQMVDDSGDRACEAISVYARGVNPSVSVSYTNVGNNGGQMSGGMQNNGGRNAKLPLTIMKDGAFRPPIYTREMLEPYSRQHRTFTKASTNPGIADYSKTRGNCDMNRNIVPTLLKALVRPTAVYKVEKSVVEPFETKYAIQPSIKVSGHSGIRPLDRTSTVVVKPTKEINESSLHGWVKTNPGDNSIYKNESNMDTRKYTQDTLSHSVSTNPGTRTGNSTSIEEVLDLSDIRTKDTMHVNYTTTRSGTERNNFDFESPELQRKLPVHNMTTNISDSRYTPVNREFDNSIEMARNTPLTSFVVNSKSNGGKVHFNTDARLASKVNPGGFEGRGTKPMEERANMIKDSYDSHKSMLEKNALAMMASKFKS